MVGEAVLDRTTGIPWIWDGSAFVEVALPVIIHEPTDNDVLSGTYPADSVIMSQGSGNVWTQTPNGLLSLGIRVYATQANLTADTPPDGTLGFAEDTGAFSVRNSGVWATLAHQGVTAGTTPPPAPVAGTMWMDTSSGVVLKVYDGANFVSMKGGATVGTALPSGGSQGDLYWRSNKQRLYVNDGSSYKGVRGFAEFGSSSPPADQGNIWIDKTSFAPGNLKALDGSNWKQIGAQKCLDIEVRNAEGMAGFSVGHFRRVEFEVVIHAAQDTNLFILFDESDPRAGGKTFLRWWYKANGGGQTDGQSTGDFGTNPGPFIGMLDAKANWPTALRCTLFNPSTSGIAPILYYTAHGVSSADNTPRVWSGIMKLAESYGRVGKLRLATYRNQTHDWTGYGFGYE